MKMNNLIGLSGPIKGGKDLVGEMIRYVSNHQHPTLEGFEQFITPSKYRVESTQKYEIKKCADKLKDCVCLILGCTREELEDRKYKETPLGEEWWLYNLFAGNGEYYDVNVTKEKALEYGNGTLGEHSVNKLTPRLILQLFGTQGGRNVVHPDIWVNALFADYKKIGVTSPYDSFDSYDTFPNWIITDVRFPQNEGKAISDRGGLLIGVRRLFRLRFPEYEDLIDATMDGYAIPEDLRDVDPELYATLTHESETSMGDHSWCDVVIENNGTMKELFDNVLEAIQYNKE
jgi:hypothetical protein